MARRDIVSERVRDLTDQFGRYVTAFDSLVPFSSDQLAAHRTTIGLRRAAGSLAEAIADPRFAASLRQTLVAWRLDSRASRLASESGLGDALRAALPGIAAFEAFHIGAADLPDSVPERLFALIASLGVADNDAKLVAGTKTLHHLLPELVPPMDRVWTGMFFGLHAPEWQGDNQRRSFLRMFRALHEVARWSDPQDYVTGEGWRTSRTKILDNAVIGYCRVELEGRSPVLPWRGEVVSFHVDGYPPAKSEALSMLGAGHSHTARVRLLLEAARRAKARSGLHEVLAGPVALEVVIHTGGDRPWDATNYLGGIADVLQDKAHHGPLVEHLGELAAVALYHDDRQITQVSYREEPRTTKGYVVTVRALAPEG